MATIDYFKKGNTTEQVLRRIKGEYRRHFIARCIADDGLDSIPPVWTGEGLPELFKGMLGRQAPNCRGGEDLPDLQRGQVEVARMVLLDSVHGEVTSLRANRKRNGTVRYVLVDEYETDFELPIETSESQLTAVQVLNQFQHAKPSATATECRIGFRSPFHPELETLAGERGLNGNVA